MADLLTMKHLRGNVPNFKDLRQFERYINAFKPSVPIQHGYCVVEPRAMPSCAALCMESQKIVFEIALTDAEWLAGGYFNIKIDALQTLDAADKLRFAACPGRLLCQNIAIFCGDLMLDEYSGESYSLCNDNILGNGECQVLRAKQPALRMSIPLLFWFSHKNPYHGKNLRLELALAAISDLIGFQSADCMSGDAAMFDAVVTSNGLAFDACLSDSLEKCKIRDSKNVRFMPYAVPNVTINLHIRKFRFPAEIAKVYRGLGFSLMRTHATIVQNVRIGLHEINTIAVPGKADTVVESILVTVTSKENLCDSQLWCCTTDECEVALVQPGDAIIWLSSSAMRTRMIIEGFEGKVMPGTYYFRGNICDNVNSTGHFEDGCSVLTRLQSDVVFEGRISVVIIYVALV